jgi:hypothetical protein
MPLTVGSFYSNLYVHVIVFQIYLNEYMYAESEGFIERLKGKCAGQAVKI